MAAGLHPFVEPNNCNYVSKREADALDIIEKAKWWINVLSYSTLVGRVVATLKATTSEIKFTNGFAIRTETQNENALRSRTGHAYCDEFAFYIFQVQIWGGGIPSTFSHPSLRVTLCSTPNGQNDLFHEVYTDENKHDDWSRHRTDIYEAIEQGANPAALADAKKKLGPNQFAQEMECVFLGGEDDVFGVELVQESYDNYTVAENRVLWFGIDVASKIDTTAIQLLWVQHDGVWAGDTYVISSTPYETNISRQRAGQHLILDALIRVHRPVGFVMDVTGDAGRRKLGTTPLFSLITQTHQQTHEYPDLLCLAQEISAKWKHAEVQELKLAMQAQRTRLIIGRRDWIYTPGPSTDYVVNATIPENPEQDWVTPQGFVDACFEESPFKILEDDFKKIVSKWSGEDVIYTTRRDATGHGDAFWGLVLGHSVARVPRANRFNIATSKGPNDAEERVTENLVPPNYLQQGW